MLRQMTDDAIEYLLPDDRGRLRFSPAVLAHLRRYRQSRPWHCEAGGQLFANVSDNLIEVVEATGPRPTDRRSIFGYKPDRDAERLEIKERYARGLHFVGDWHTHRQRFPLLSSTDIESIGETVRLSDHNLTGFVLVVVGTARFPAGLHVSFHGSSTHQELTPIPTASSPEVAHHLRG
jgi:integrative and conjugative element protein (TIGR02256 family)